MINLQSHTNPYHIVKVKNWMWIWCVDRFDVKYERSIVFSTSDRDLAAVVCASMNNAHRVGWYDAQTVAELNRQHEEYNKNKAKELHEQKREGNLLY